MRPGRVEDSDRTRASRLGVTWGLGGLQQWQRQDVLRIVTQSVTTHLQG